MRVFLDTAYRQGVALRYLQEAAAHDQFRQHRLVERSDDADIVLFVENGEPQDPWYKALSRHPRVRRERERVFMYNEWDFPYRVLPGLYASMPKRAFDPDCQVACAYLFKPNEFIAPIAALRRRPSLLYSFAGRRFRNRASVLALLDPRARVLALSDPRAHIEDTSTTFSLWTQNTPDELLRRKRSYAELIADSKFVLCPRGAGTSSYRFFETLEASRAPVVISDEWVAPYGPDWSFLVRVPEREVESIPQLLRALEPEAGDRGWRARQVWEEWFAPNVVFHHMISSLEQLHKRNAGRRRPRDLLPDPEYVRLRFRIAALDRARAVRDGVRRVRSSLRAT